MTSTETPGRLPGHVTAIAATFLVSCSGDGLAITALMLDFHDRGTGGTGIAALFAAMSLPAVLLAALAGRIADRHSARRVLPALGAALVAVCVLMSFARAPWLLVSLFAVLSGLMAIASPVFVKAVLDASPGPLMSRAGAQVAMASSLGFLIGPAVGAGLMDAVGLRGVLLADAVTYLAVPLVALLIPKPDPTTRPDEGPPPQPAASGLLPGLRVLVQQPAAARIVVVGTVLTFTLQVTNVVEVYLVRDGYQATATVFGLVTMVWAAGQILGSGAAGRALAERPTANTAALTVAAVAAALLAIALFDSLPGLFVLTLLAGACNGAFGVARQTTLGRAVAPASRGSAVAAHAALLNSATVLALMAAGIVSTRISPRAVYAAAGLTLLLTLVAAALYRPAGGQAKDGKATTRHSRNATPTAALPQD